MGEMSESVGQTAGDVVQPNSYVLVDYTISVKETGELVDTTVEEEARKYNVYAAMLADAVQAARGRRARGNAEACAPARATASSG
jgi:FKBP-type peptidyl-prolyl cis-trans isomerase 2